MSSSERGAATVLGVSVLAVLLLVGTALAVVAGMFRAHRVAESAADLAALAAAGALARGEDACATGARIAARNDAVLVDCRTAGWEVWVAVTVPGPRWLGHGADLAARARAGPGPGSRGGEPP